MTELDTDSYTHSASWRRLALLSLVFVAMTAIGLYIVFTQFAGRHVSFDSRLIEPQALACITLLLLAYFSLDGLRLYFTLRTLGYKLPFKAIFRLVFINLFFSNITPMATGGGFAQVWFLTQQGVPVGQATAATTIRTLLAVVVIFTLTPIFLLTINALSLHPISGDIGIALVFFIVLYLLFFAIVLFKSHWIMAPLAGLLTKLERWGVISHGQHQRWQFKLRREMLRFSRSFRVYLHGRLIFIFLSIACTLGFLLALFSFPALLMHSLGYDVHYLTTIGLLVVTTFIMYFAPTPGASGISESVFASFFHNIISGNHLILITLAWRFLTIYLGMIIGLVVLQKHIISNKALSK